MLFSIFMPVTIREGRCLFPEKTVGRCSASALAVPGLSHSAARLERSPFFIKSAAVDLI